MVKLLTDKHFDFSIMAMIVPLRERQINGKISVNAPTTAEKILAVDKRRLSQNGLFSYFV